MTTPNDTIYPQLLPEPKARELIDFYTPTDPELTWAKKSGTPLKRIGLLILLKCTQRLGYFPLTRDVPRPYLDYITHAGGMVRTLNRDEIKALDHGQTRQNNIELIRKRMEIRPLEDDDWLLSQAHEAAQTQHHVSDIVNVLVEELVHHRYELPGFSTLQRAAVKARDIVEEAHYDAIAKPLSADVKESIDRLFTMRTGGKSAWNDLKQEPARPTSSAVREYLEHVRNLQKLSAGLPSLNAIPVTKLEQYQLLARSERANEMRELKPNKRYALAVIYIKSCLSRALDDAGDLYMKLFGRMQAAATRNLREYQVERSMDVEALLARFRETLLAYQVDGDVKQRMHAIDVAVRNEAAKLIALCEQHLGYANNNSLPFLLTEYPKSRVMLYNSLEIIKPRSTSDQKSMETMLQVLQLLRKSKAENVSLQELGLKEEELYWMKPPWRRLVLGLRSEGMPEGMVNRKALEVAIHERICQELENGDMYIDGGERYDDYREQLVDKETFQKEVAKYGEVTGIEIEPKAMVMKMRAELVRRSSEVDQGFARNEHASIVDGRLSLRKLPKTDVPDAAVRLDAAIKERLPPIGILDALIDVERWLNLSGNFKHLAGSETRMTNLPERFVTALFCYGCNVGATQTSRSVKGINPRQIGWLNLKYIEEEALEKAIVQVTNAYAKFELPGYWGDRMSASADGTKWGLADQNLMSEYHIRYGGYGGIGYYHVSATYVALFSRFIPCGVYEGIHIIDGLLDNESDIQPDTLHGDTHSQNYGVFAISFLLGIKLMPRIRGMHRAHFFKPSGSAKYKNIEDVFHGNINWRLIETHYNEMLRVVVSIKKGKIKAATILRRLGAKNQSKLALAFRELGKAVRTLFLLDYVETPELRKTISAATNKSEAFNNFIQWVFFGDEGVIQENVAHEQRKVIKYSHLVANMVCLHNVQTMSNAIRQLRREGTAITPELVAFLSPYRTGHLNRLGNYELDFGRPSEPLTQEVPLFK